MRLRVSPAPGAAAALILLAVTSAQAGSITLEWDSVPQATGYRVYYGRNPGQYTGSLDAGSATRVSVSGLSDCTSWYLAVKAYNAVGESSGFSNEISGWPRPELLAPSPVSSIQGSQFTLDIRGANFQPGASVEIGERNTFLSPAVVVSCNEIQVATTIEPTANGVRPAEIGRYTVTVVNPDDVFGTKTQAFEIKVNPARFDVDRRQGPSKGRLDGRDTIWISRLFASREGDATYDPDSDLNGDGWVDGDDLAYVASYMGACWSGGSWSTLACPDSFD